MRKYGDHRASYSSQCTEIVCWAHAPRIVESAPKPQARHSLIFLNWTRQRDAVSANAFVFTGQCDIENRASAKRSCVYAKPLSAVV